MRLIPATALLVVLTVPGPAASAATTHAAPARIVSWRPQVWRPAPAETPSAAPAPAAAPAAVRSDPVEPGSPIAPELAAAMAAHRAALAAVPAVRRADGSRSAVLGGLARRWTVARIGDDGALHESCVSTEGEARAAVGAAGKER